MGTWCTVGELKARVANDYGTRRSCQKIISPDGLLLADATHIIDTVQWLVITDLVNAAARMHVDVDLALVESVYECAVCQADHHLLLCGRCLVTRYCSYACQQADWISHRTNCRSHAH